MDKLKKLLEKEIETNKKNIQEEVHDFEKKDFSYRNIEISENINLILRKNGYEKLMLIGFPFPLESYPLNSFISEQSTLMFIFFKGKLLRDFQREELLDKLGKIKHTEYVEISSLKEFRKISKAICNKYELVDYYDPYSFLGDSFIGLHFIENFEKSFDFKLNKIYSDNHKNLSIAAETSGYIGQVPKKSGVVNVFSDLIDNQWDRTKYLVTEFAKQNLSSFICGRDLIIEPTDSKIKIYHFSRDEILLKGENIEDYMNKCLNPFLIPKHNSFNVRKSNSLNIIINPFGSEDIKTIPEKIVYDVAQHCSKTYPNIKILIVAGFKNSYMHLLWISKLKGLLNSGNINNVIFKNYGSIADIHKDIKRYDCRLGLTADTSVAHLFNYIGLQNLTFFNINRCDLKSPQSLSSDGPLGFCRYGKVQYPVLFGHIDNDKLIKPLLCSVDYFLDKSKKTNWTNGLFDSKILVSEMNLNQEKELLLSNKKINPKYKLND